MANKSPKRSYSPGFGEEMMYAEPTEFDEDDPANLPRPRLTKKQAEAVDPEAEAVDPEERSPTPEEAEQPAPARAKVRTKTRKAGLRRGTPKKAKKAKAPSKAARSTQRNPRKTSARSVEELVAEESEEEPIEEPTSSTSRSTARKKPERKPKQENQPKKPEQPRRSTVKPHVPPSTRKLRRRPHEPRDPQCTFCQVEQAFENEEELKNCFRCEAPYHVRKCLWYNANVVAIIKTTEEWLCPRCQFCESCKQFVDDSRNKECALCLKAWHGPCAPLGNCPSGQYNGDWFCPKCCWEKGLVIDLMPKFLPLRVPSPEPEVQERMLFFQRQRQKIIDDLKKQDDLLERLQYEFGIVIGEPEATSSEEAAKEEAVKDPVENSVKNPVEIADEKFVGEEMVDSDQEPMDHSDKTIEIYDMEEMVRGNEAILDGVKSQNEDPTPMEDATDVMGDCWPPKSRKAAPQDPKTGAEGGDDEEEEEDDKDVPGPSTRAPKSRPSKEAIREVEKKKEENETDEEDEKNQQGCSTSTPFFDPYVNHPLRSPGSSEIPETGEGYRVTKPNRKYMNIGPVTKKMRRKIHVTQEYINYLRRQKDQDHTLRVMYAPKEYNYLKDRIEGPHIKDPFILKFESGVQWVHLGLPLVAAALHNSAYPEPTNSHTHLWVCKFCLDVGHQRAKWVEHYKICTARFPPGNEIYRQDKISFFEVDDQKQTEYCQRLSLFAKLFIGSKTEWERPQTFVYYVLCELHRDGYVILGYFSKEKNPSDNNNLSCLLVLPTAQRKGYGRMLIDLSYELSRMELRVGHPEHPLSDLGLLAYRGYWRSSLLCYLRKVSQSKNAQTIKIKDIALATRITENEVVQQLLLDKCLVFADDKYHIKIG